MKKILFLVVFFCCFSCVLAFSDREKIEVPHNSLSLVPIKVMPVYVAKNYDYTLTLEDEKRYRTMKSIFESNLLKGVVSYADFYVEEDDRNWYFITRESFKTKRGSDSITINRDVCYSHLSDSKYTANLVFVHKRDPLLKEGITYHLSDIEIGFMYVVKKVGRKCTMQVIPFFASMEISS